jgi:hypothetical protein
MRSWLWCLLPWLAACGGQAGGVNPGAEDADVVSAGADHAGDNAGAASAPALTESELRGEWQELAVPGPGDVEAIVEVPGGYLALRRESVGEGKVGLFQSHLYRSPDGVRWSEVPLDSQHPNFGLRGLAYAGGRYVMAGDRYLLTSDDGSSWSEQVMPWNDGNTLADVVVSNGRFFVLGTFRRMLTSSDPGAWTELDMATLGQTGVAFGAGTYVLTGSGPIQSSSDGLSWHGTTLDCALPDACVTNPDGVVGPGYLVGAFYLDGRFYTGEIVSDDAVAWRASGDPYPEYLADGYFFGRASAAGSLRAWKPGSPPIELTIRPPSEGNGAVPSGTTCETRRCIVLGERLLLSL